MKKVFLLLVVLMLVGLFGQAQTLNSSAVVQMKTEYQTEPMGISVSAPRFSWQMAALNNKIKGLSQKFYSITVTDDNNNIVWKTGKVKSANSFNIRYNGEPLKPMTQYKWCVEVWNNKGQHTIDSSWFETSLALDCELNDSADVWSDAYWIGAADSNMVLYSHYLPVYALQWKMQCSPESLYGSVFYGANDERLDKGSYVRVELDLLPLQSGKESRLNVYRVGYDKNDNPDTPIATFNIPFDRIDSNNIYAQHTIKLTSNLGFTRFYVNDGTHIGEYNLNHKGWGGDFIAYPVVGDIAFVGQNTKFTDFEILNYREPGNSILKFDTICATSEPIYFTPKGGSQPILRSEFTVKSRVKSARLYATSRGIYDVYINGNRVNNDYFSPGFTQYNKSQLYQIYDVTNCLKIGNNAIGAILGEGWWSGGATYMGEYWNFFGDRQSFLSKLVVRYEDGTEDIFVTNPKTWKVCTDGYIKYGSFFQGEVFDALVEKQMQGWSCVGYNTENWNNAVQVSLDGNIYPLDYSNLVLIPENDNGVTAVKELVAKSVNEIRPNVYIYDMGQNLAGVPYIQFSGLNPGNTVKLRFAEVLYPNLPEYNDQVGELMLENIRAAMAQDIYVAKGGEESFSPRFTYHGYRYVEISGLDKPLPLECVKAKVLSSIQEFTATYQTSDSLVNKLWNNIGWSALSNFVSIPTDCPQRNERLGWSGDISVFSKSATYLAHIPQFLRRHMRAMREVQRNDGRFPDIAPLGIGFGGMLWGSAGITVAWESYLQFKDIDMLKEHYGSMKSYIEYLKSMIDNDNIFVQTRTWIDLTDWLGPEDGKNDKSLLWEAYYIYDLELMSKIATILGNKHDADYYASLRSDRIEHFLDTYIEQESGKTIHSNFEPSLKGKEIGTQTSYVLPLAFGIVSKERDEVLYNKFVENFVGTLENASPKYSLLTGFIGTAWISKVLSDCGRDDLAYKLLLQSDYPSWLYSVTQGATTIWERLNSYTHMNGFGGNNRMNSFNHYSFGAVCSWMMEYSAGIKCDNSNPDNPTYVISPKPDPSANMKFAHGSFNSLYGIIESGWAYNEKLDKCTYKVTVPANTKLKFIINGKTKSLKSGIYQFTKRVVK